MVFIEARVYLPVHDVQCLHSESHSQGIILACRYSWMKAFVSQFNVMEEEIEREREDGDVWIKCV